MASVKVLMLIAATMMIQASSAQRVLRDFHIDAGTPGIRTYTLDTSADADDMIVQGETVGAEADSSRGRRSCYLGDSLLYTEGNVVYDEDRAMVVTTPNGEDIYGLACCCNMVAITYTDTNTALIVEIHLQTFLGPFVRHDLGEDKTFALAYCSAEARTLVLLSIESVWEISIDSLQTLPEPTSLTPPLSTLPTCLAYRQKGLKGDRSFDLFVTLIAANTITAMRFVQTDGVYQLTDTGSFALVEEFAPRPIYCVGIDGFTDDLYILSSANRVAYDVRKLSADMVFTNPDQTPQVVDGLANTGQLENSIGGFSVCGPECNQYAACNVEDPSCSCNGASLCGFCAVNNAQCQCEDSRDEECIYPENLIDVCTQCLARLDASLLVKNPIAQRSTGEIEVFGVMRGESADITISREVKVGRFEPEYWPLPVDATSAEKNIAGLTVIGFEAPPPSELRGSRFGVFRADFQPIDSDGQRKTSIAGVITENSGFTNAIVTKTVSRGDDVKLEASMVEGLLKFSNTLQWRVTKIDPVTGEPEAAVTPDCDFDPDRLTCALADVTKESDEGVYEVFRPSRRLRNWHPIFYLYVRECAEGWSGSSCDKPCPACVNGQCDNGCGECVCYPGWTGADCNTACTSEANFGDDCNMACSDVFAENENCMGVLICRPDQTGCSCRSGLQPPECMEPCEEGYWGPNCLNECDCDDPTCDARTGSCSSVPDS